MGLDDVQPLFRRRAPRGTQGARMIPLKETPFGPVNIVVPGLGAPRVGAFEMALQMLQVPVESTLSRTWSGSVAKNRNLAIKQALETAEYHLLVDDDHGFPEDALFKLLVHQQPVVSAFVTSKLPPWYPIVMKAMRLDPRTNRPDWQIYTWQELDGKHGLLPVYAAGTGCLLVHKAVFRRLPEPWFEVGHYNGEDLHEDMYFSEKLRRANIPIAVDLDTPITHWDSVGVGPTRLADGRWSVRLHWNNGETVLMGRQDEARPQAGGTVKV